MPTSCRTSRCGCDHDIDDMYSQLQHLLAQTRGVGCHVVFLGRCSIPCHFEHTCQTVQWGDTAVVRTWSGAVVLLLKNALSLPAKMKAKPAGGAWLGSVVGRLELCRVGSRSHRAKMGFPITELTEAGPIDVDDRQWPDGSWRSSVGAGFGAWLGPGSGGRLWMSRAIAERGLNAASEL